MERIIKCGDTKFQSKLGHNSDILHSWSTLEDTLYNKGTLSAELKEQVRRTLAYGNECPYCMAKGRPDDAKGRGEVAALLHLFMTGNR